jgi:ferritin-like protein
MPRAGCGAAARRLAEQSRRCSMTQGRMSCQLAGSDHNQERTMSSIGYHEPVEELSAETRDMHKAIVSLMEELEAVDWYNQRADVCKDMELKAILEHNRDEEKEHASMLLEWIRRKDQSFSAQFRSYLFSEKPISHK